MLPTDMYHVGIVVPRLEDGQAHFADLFGVRWAPVMEAPTAMRTADGSVATVDLRLVYSIDAPHLELIEAVPGSIWVLNPHSNIHHIGFWSNDLGDDLARLHGGGCPLEVMGDSGGVEPLLWSYHSDRLGVRIELVDEALRAGMQAAWDGAADALEAPLPRRLLERRSGIDRQRDAGDVAARITDQEQDRP